MSRCWFGLRPLQGAFPFGHQNAGIYRPNFLELLTVGLFFCLKRKGETRRPRILKGADYHNDHESEEGGKDMHIPMPSLPKLILILACPIVFLVLLLTFLIYCFRWLSLWERVWGGGERQGDDVALGAQWFWVVVSAASLCPKSNHTIYFGQCQPKSLTYKGLYQLKFWHEICRHSIGMIFAGRYLRKSFDSK